MFLNIAQNVSMLIKWHYDCPNLERFYFDVSCEKLDICNLLGLRLA
jgi:hypothetical protein